MSELPASPGSASVATGARQASRAFFEAQAFPAYLLLATQILFVSGAVLSTDFTYEGKVLDGAFACLGILGACALGARWSSFARLAGTVEAVVLMGTMNLVAPLAATLLASANRPLADPLLSYLDKLLFFGFDRRVMAAGMAEWPPVVMEWTRLIYHSIGPQSLIAIAALFFLRQERRAWTFATAWMLALMTCVALSPLFPALGTPPYSLDFIGAFEGARNGTLRTLGVQSLTGIVTFPSFHAAGAVLLGWGFWSIRAAAPFFVPLNVLMFASALFVGGHYLIDLFAGAAVAAASLFVSSKFIGAFAPATPAKAGSRAFNLRRPPARPAR